MELSISDFKRYSSNTHVIRIYDEEELLSLEPHKSESNKKRRSISRKRKSRSSKSSTKQRKSLSKSLDKFRREHSKGRKTSRSLFKALKGKMLSPTSIPGPLTVDLYAEELTIPSQKIAWKPALRVIYDDALLLNALVKYMTRSYCAENIEFINSVKELGIKNEGDIDQHIHSIYSSYIGPNAPDSVRSLSSIHKQR